jgi:hypothetical protein
LKAFAFSLLLALASCEGKPAAGNKCTNAGRFVCGDAVTALYCEGGTYRAVSCRGARGCSGGIVAPSCDDRSAIEGESCMPPSNDDRACTSDRARALVCRDGRWEAWRACKGARGCVAMEDRVECDATIASVGDPCASSDAWACSVDGASLLACKGEKMDVARTCRGSGECKVDIESRKVACDDSVALEGDACDPAGARACSVDKKSELACESGRFVKARPCSRRDGCAPQRGAQPLCVE